MSKFRKMGCGWKKYFLGLNLFSDRSLLLFLFLLSTGFFFYQYATQFSWDFSSYVLNAQYWFDGGSYFEPLRPPLMGFLLGVFSFLGWEGSVYLFLFFASLGFFYSCKKLSLVLGFSQVGFYALSLNFFVLFKGLINGTELLALVFLQLGIAALLSKEGKKSGFYFGMSALSRYAGLAYAPLLLLHLNIKKIVQSVLLFFLTMSPWFLYNYYYYGNFFFSIADQYANNILFRRSYINHPWEIWHFLSVAGLLLPLFLVGVLFVVFTFAKKRQWIGKQFEFEKWKAHLIMVYLFLQTSLTYFTTPMKHERYLFMLILPAVYFSYLGVRWFVRTFGTCFSSFTFTEKKLVLFLFLVHFVSVLLFPTFFPHLTHTVDRYTGAIEVAQEYGLGSCEIISNEWVPLNMLGVTSRPPYYKEQIKNRLSSGEIGLFYYANPEPGYHKDTSFLSDVPVIYSSEEFIVLGEVEDCVSPYVYDASYVSGVATYVSEIHGYEITQESCTLLFYDNNLLERVCNFLHGKGFSLGENREIA